MFTSSSGRIALALLALGWTMVQAEAAAGINAVGGWNQTVDSRSLTAGAGSDPSSTLQSSSGVAMLSISGTGGSWRIDMRRTDTSWPAQFVLAAKRSGNGTGSGTVTAGSGTSYATVATATTTFFTGRGTVSNIPLQLQLSGLSVAIPPGSYATTITFTVVGN